jgi:hypothetical protein
MALVNHALLEMMDINKVEQLSPENLNELNEFNGPFIRTTGLTPPACFRPAATLSLAKGEIVSRGCRPCLLGRTRHRGVGEYHDPSGPQGKLFGETVTAELCRGPSEE